MGGLNEYLNLGGVEAAEPEQEARKGRIDFFPLFSWWFSPLFYIDHIGIILIA